MSRMRNRNDDADDSITAVVDSLKVSMKFPKTPGHGSPRKVRKVFQKSVNMVTSALMSPFKIHAEKDLKLIVDALKRNFFLRKKTDEQLDRLAESFVEQSYKKGANIIQQGEPGDFFYVLKSGSVQFIVDGVKTSKTSKAGASFGELALLYTSPRGATVVALEDSTFYRISQENFRSILQSQTESVGDEKLKLLQGINFLQSLSKGDLTRLAAAMTPRPFAANKLLVKKGDVGNEFWILQSGKAKVTHIVVGSSTFEDQILGPGGHFGERALMMDEPRVANVTSITAGVAFTIDRKTFEAVLGKMSSVIVKAHDARTLGGISFFVKAELDASQLVSLSALVRHKAFPQGDVIMKMGSMTEPKIYLVREGEVEVKSEEKTVVIGRGGYFGDELLSRTETNRTVTSPITVKALQTCLCGVLSLKDCRTMIDTDRVEEKAQRRSQGASLRLQGKLKEAEVLELAMPVLPDRPEGLQRHVMLGEGIFGQVWLVTNKEDKDNGEARPYALKVLSKYELMVEGQEETVMREKDTMQGLDHPFIVKLYKTYQDDNFLYSVIDYIPGGELFSVMHPKECEDGVKLPESQVKFYALGIADAIAYMHKSQIVYRDLKPENVLIDAKGYPVIIDFGFAKRITGPTYTFCGTPSYMAPEVILSSGHDTSSDHWSFGILLYEMLMAEGPFYKECYSQMNLLLRVIVEDMPATPVGVSAQAQDIIQKLLEQEPTRRLGSLARGEADILQHDWFEGFDLQDIRRKKVPAPWFPAIKNAMDTSCFESWTHLDDKQTKSYPKLLERENAAFKGF